MTSARLGDLGASDRTCILKLPTFDKVYLYIVWHCDQVTSRRRLSEDS